MSAASRNAEVLSRLNVFRKEGKFCDVKLIVEGVEFPAHKNVLAAAFTAFFEPMFLGEFAEANKDSITLECVELSSMESLLDYAYTAEANLTNDNIQAMLQAGHFLQDEHLFRVCCEYLKSNLSTENCIGVYNLSDIYLSNDLREAAKKFLLAHFLAVSQEVDFFELEANKLIGIVDDDALFAEKEEHVFDAVMRWFHYKEGERKESLCKVLSHVRLSEIDPYFLHSRVKGNKALAESESCTKLMMDVLFYQRLRNRRNELSATFSRPRDSKNIVEALLLSGNCKRTQTTKHVCVAANGEIIIGEFHLPFNYPVFSYSSTSSSDAFLVDGESGFVWHHNCKQNEWKPTQVKVEYLNKGVRNVDGRWYTFGFCSSSLEVYENSGWKTLAKPTAAAVHHPNVVTVNGLIYVLGGKTKDKNTSTLIQQYDPHTDTWSQVGHLPKGRESLRTCVLNGRIYVFSEKASNDSLPKTREIGEMDILTSQWNTVGTIPEKFADFKICSVTAFASNIYVVMENDKNKCEIQVYSPASNSWRDFPALPQFDIQTIRCSIRVPRPSAATIALPTKRVNQE